jgi:hypothetical protein
MSRSTSALLTAGGRLSGPWADRLWRIALSAQYVSGGSADYWLVTPTLPVEHLVQPGEIEIQVADTEGVLDSVLMMLAAHLGGQHEEELLLETHNISLDAGTRAVAPFWELDGRSRAQLASELSNVIRLGITLLEPGTLANASLVQALRSAGFDVDVFELSSSGLLA